MTKIPEAKGFSIWLMFVKEDELKLQKLIDHLCNEFNSPFFRPHLTLLSKIENRDNLIDRFSQLVENLEPFDLNIIGIKYSNEFYKSLYLEIERNKTLEDLFLKAVYLYDGVFNLLDFKPHISLLYTNEYDENKKSIIQEVQELNLTKVKVNKISLIKTQGTPNDWAELISLHL
ncbi:MAG: 2'-5' RNA ligase family protein [Ignavibacteria bacterium]